MSKQIWTDTPTILDLNGPTISIVTNPSSITVNHQASATFVGLATVTFPAEITGTFDGTVVYQWYDQDGALGASTQWSGQTSSTLVISSATSPGFNGKQYYFVAEYVPVSVDGTGNAINEPVTSGTATLTVRPGMAIITFPSNATAVVNNNATFNAGGFLTDYVGTVVDEGSQGVISYQWFVNGSTASDGTTQTTSSATNFSTRYTSNSTITIPDDATNVRIRIFGAAGGYGGTDTNGSGGNGGNGKSGTFSLPDGGRTLDLLIGSRGPNANPYAGGSSSVSAGGRGGSGNSSGQGGAGGGGTFVFDRLSNTYILAAGSGAGGGGGSYNESGTGGGSAGNWQSVSGGLTGITAGAAGGDSGGTDGGGGGGGGGGYRGGNGGSSGQDNPPPPPPPPPPPSGGGGGSIICEKLAELGYFNQEMNKADQRFAVFLKKKDHRAYYGYLTWAQTVVELMNGKGPEILRKTVLFWEKDEFRRINIQIKIVSFYMNALAKPWAEEMAYRMGAKGYEKSNSAGKLMMDIGLPLCRKIGKTQSNKKMNSSVKVAVIWGTTTILLIGVTTISTIDLVVNKVKGVFK